jgi:hypothetical protein
MRPAILFELADDREIVIAYMEVMMDDHVIMQINDLSLTFGRTFLEIGKLLRTIKEEDPETFKAIPDTTPIGRRKSFALVRIDKVFGKLGVPDERLVAIGWAKLNIIAPFVTPKTCELLLSLAEHHRFLDLERVLRGEKPILGARVVMLEFSPADYEVFAETLQAFGAVPCGKGLVGEEQAILAAFAHLKPKLGGPYAKNKT